MQSGAIPELGTVTGCVGGAWNLERHGLDTECGPGTSLCVLGFQRTLLSLLPSLCSWRAGCWPNRLVPPAQLQG